MKLSVENDNPELTPRFSVQNQNWVHNVYWQIFLSYREVSQSPSEAGKNVLKKNGTFFYDLPELLKTFMPHVYNRIELQLPLVDPGRVQKNTFIFPDLVHIVVYGIWY